MQTGYIEKLQLQRGKKVPYESVPFLRLEEGQGIIGDCHFGGGDKQISFLSDRLTQWIQLQEVPGLCFPKFQGNVITKGIDYSKLTVGDILITEHAQIIISAYPKHCFSECMRLQQKLSCELVDAIAFARVLRSGIIQNGDKVWMN